MTNKGTILNTFFSKGIILNIFYRNSDGMFFYGKVEASRNLFLQKDYHTLPLNNGYAKELIAKFYDSVYPLPNFYFKHVESPIDDSGSHGEVWFFSVE